MKDKSILWMAAFGVALFLFFACPPVRHRTVRAAKACWSQIRAKLPRRAAHPLFCLDGRQDPLYCVDQSKRIRYRRHSWHFDSAYEKPRYWVSERELRPSFLEKRAKRIGLADVPNDLKPDYAT
jgi:hypothetical protein